MILRNIGIMSLCLASFSTFALTNREFSKLNNALNFPQTPESYNFTVESATNLIMKDYSKHQDSSSLLNLISQMTDLELQTYEDVIERLSNYIDDIRITQAQEKLEKFRSLQAEDAKRIFLSRDKNRSTEVKVVDLTYDQIEGLELTGSKFPDKTILLTFDDGPHGYRTQKIMDALDQYQIPATFFEVGSSINSTLKDQDKNLVKGVDIAQDVIDRGHTLATHTWNHPALGKTSIDAGKKNVDKAIKQVIEKLNYFPHYFRYPYGSKNKSVLKYMNEHNYGADVTNGSDDMIGIKSIYWHMDSNDWKTKNPTTLVKNCLKIFNQEKRGVFLMHDIHYQTEVAFPIILDKLVEDGWTFVRLVN